MLIFVVHLQLFDQNALSFDPFPSLHMLINLRTCTLLNAISGDGEVDSDHGQRLLSFLSTLPSCLTGLRLASCPLLHTNNLTHTLRVHFPFLRALEFSQSHHYNGGSYRSVRSVELLNLVHHPPQNLRYFQLDTDIFFGDSLSPEDEDAADDLICALLPYRFPMTVNPVPMMNWTNRFKLFKKRFE